MRWSVVPLVLVVAAACARGSAPSGRPEASTPPSPSTPRAGRTTAAGQGAAELPDARLSLSADPVPARVGAPVTLTLRLEARRELVLHFTTGQRYDFEAEGPSGGWRWSAGRLFTQAVGEMQLRSGEERSYQERWVPVQRGTYLLRGRVTASGRPELTVEVAIEVSA